MGLNRVLIGALLGFRGPKRPLLAAFGIPLNKRTKCRQRGTSAAKASPGTAAPEKGAATNKFGGQVGNPNFISR